MKKKMMIVPLVSWVASVSVMAYADNVIVPISASAENPQHHVPFGNILSGERVQSTITVVNATGARVKLRSMADCGCTNIQLVKAELEPNEETAVTIEYDSTLSLNSVGRIQKRFLIVDAESSTKVYLVGSVSVDVRASLHLTPDEVRFVATASQEATKTRLRIRNDSTLPAKIAWQPETTTLDSIRVEPAEFSVAPSAHVDVAVHVTGLSKQPSRSGQIVFAGTVAGANGPVAVTYKVPATVVMRQPVTPIPGSFILTMKDIEERAERTLTVRALKDAKVVVTGVEASADWIKVSDLGGGKYNVRFQGPYPKGVVFESINIKYVAADHEATVEVPVYLGSSPSK